MRSIMMAGLSAAVIGAASTGCGKDCEDLGGTWTVAQHCVTTFVGQSVPVTQTDCNVDVGGTFAGFSGTVAGSQISINGTPAGTTQTQSCSGTATSTRITMTCQPDGCGVTLEK